MSKKLKIVIAFFLVALGTAFAEVNPYEEVEIIPYVPATEIDIEVHSAVEFDPQSEDFLYSYDLRTATSSRQSIQTFDVVAVAECTEIRPLTWEWSGSRRTPSVGEFPIVGWGVGIDENGLLLPGSSKQMSFLSGGIPKIVLSYTRGDVPPPTGQQVIDPTVKRPPWYEDSVQVPTLGPDHRPSLPLDGVAFAERLLGLSDEAQELEWITEANSQALLQTELEQIRQQLDEDQTNQARETIEALLLSLDEHRGQGFNDSAYYLFKANLEFFLHHLETEPGVPISLNLTLHSKHVMPHRNQRVELEVTPSTPANLVFTLYRVANRNLPNDLGEPVYTETATGVSSSYVFTWEGQTTTGEPAHNGNYELVVAAGGASQSVSVQVNRQQGKQSWLKFGTRTLAYLGHSTLIASVGYALLPGVHWLASLGGPAAGEKVAWGR